MSPEGPPQEAQRLINHGVVTEQVCVCSLNNRGKTRRDTIQINNMIATHFSVHFHAILTLYSKRFHIQNLHAPLERGTSFKIQKKKKIKMKMLPICDSLLCRWKLCWRHLIQVTILEFHNMFWQHVNSQATLLGGCHMGWKMWSEPPQAKGWVANKTWDLSELSLR